MRGSPSIALAFATIERPQVAQRLVLSARRHLGAIPLYVADQSRDVGAMASFYAAHETRLLRMPYDIGVTASRNRLAREISEDYFILCDDDFVMGPQTNFRDALRILEAEPEIGVVGGRLYDFDGHEETTRNWEMFLQYDVGQRILFSLPIYDLAPRARELGGVRYFLCDAVMNFCVMRREMFQRGVAWDERFKSNGEHEDFFLNLKLNTPYRVAYLPTLRAYHHHPEEARQYRKRLRDRNIGWRLFLDKWGLEQHIEYGLGVRNLDDIDAVVPEADARARFFLNADLSMRRDTPLEDALLVSPGGVIAAVGALDQQGEPVAQTRLPFGALLLDRRSAALVAMPEPTPIEAESLDVAEKYRLTPTYGKPATHDVDGHTHFRFDALLREGRDFILWFYRDRPAVESRRRRLAAVVRWTCDDGEPLVWRTPRIEIDLDPADHWRPLLLQAPLAPEGVRWLRFELIADGGAEAAPVSTGFLFASAGEALPACETLALSRLPRDGVELGVKGAPLAELGRAARPIAIDVGSPFADIALLKLDETPGLEALYFENWRGLGRNLVGARLPGATPSEPRLLALPKEDWLHPASRVYGFGARLGLVRLRPAEGAALDA